MIARLLEHPARSFANRSDWSAHLDRLGISALKVNPDPALIATEGALCRAIPRPARNTNIPLKLLGPGRAAGNYRKMLAHVIDH